GSTCVALAGYALFAVPRRSRRFAGAMLVLTILLAFGRYTPLFAVLYRLPGFSSFRGLSKFLFLTQLFLPMLAAIGLDALLRRAGSFRLAIVSASLALALVAAALGVRLLLADGTSAAPWARLLKVVCVAAPDRKVDFNPADAHFITTT